MGAKLTVREGQAAILFRGRAELPMCYARHVHPLNFESADSFDHHGLEVWL